MIVTNIKEFDCCNLEKELVAAGEKRYNDKMSDVCRKIIESKSKIIFISGPSCSGKTTTTNILSEACNKSGKEVKEISLDDFYLDRDHLAEIAAKNNKEVDIESAEAIDLAYLKECVDRLFAGEVALLPTFDFTTAKRAGYTPFKMSENTVLMFEGIQAIYPEVLCMFSGREYVSIYISVASSITVNGEVFTPEDIRLTRRLVRDERTRNASAVRTFELWDGVVANERKNIVPNAVNSDIVINSAFDFELYMIKDRLQKVLSKVPCDSIFYAKANQLMDKFKNIPSITDRYLSDDSLYREFIGKRS